MEGANRVQVFARVRPLGGHEAGSNACVEADDGTNSVFVRDEAAAAERVLQGEAVDAAVEISEARTFTFDAVFPSEATQRDVFMQVGLPVLRECLQGFNGTIFAYGQTGSGKTFSLLNQAQRGEDAGLLPRLVAALFVHVARERESVYEVEVAALQVYNEQVDDLLDPGHQSGAGHCLSIRDGGIVPDLTWTRCKRPDEMLDVFMRARSNIIYAETKMNKASSRSHAVFQMRITKRPRATAVDGTETRKVQCTCAKLNVVDLAGSERVKRSGVAGTQFKEATAINKSLLTLGNVVSALASKKKHVPFRDSKLTRLLDGSIGGNCKTALLVCASPAAENVAETVNALEFALRAMRIEVDAKVNTNVVEVNAQALLNDLNTNADDLGLHFGPELEALQKSSCEAIERAEEEAKRQQKAAEIAEVEARRLQQAAMEAESLAKTREKEVAVLRQAQGQAENEAKRQQKAAESARDKTFRFERAVQEAEAVAKAKSDELDKLQQTLKQAKDQIECLRRDALELTHHGDGWRQSAEEQAVEIARFQQDANKLSEQLKEEQRMGKREVELARAAEDEAAQAYKERDAALTRASTAEAALEAKHAKLADEHDARIRQFEVVRAHEAELQQHKIETLRKEAIEATRRGDTLEAELMRSTAELTQRTAALEKASAEIDQLHAESEGALAQLRRDHGSEFQAATAVHQAELARLDVLLEDTRSQHAAGISATEARLDDERTRWSIERAELVAAQAAATEAQAVAFEARLCAGRDEFDRRIASLEHSFDEERQELQQQFEEQSRELDRREMKWRESKDEAVQDAWSRGNSQKRRLAAAFKAARCVATVKETELKESYESLAHRFAVRESRDEDLKEISEQRRCLEAQRQGLHDRDMAVDSLNLILENRDANDRIFGGSSMRTAGGSRAHSGPPGKKGAATTGHRRSAPRPVSADRRSVSANLSMQSVSSHMSALVF